MNTTTAMQATALGSPGQIARRQAPEVTHEGRQQARRAISMTFFSTKQVQGFPEKCGTQTPEHRGRREVILMPGDLPLISPARRLRNQRNQGELVPNFGHKMRIIRTPPEDQEPQDHQMPSQCLDQGHMT